MSDSFGICTCGKEAFGARGDAQERAALLRRTGKNFSRKRERLAVYFCELGECWHVGHSRNAKSPKRARK